MANEGIKLSLPGQSVQNAPDYQLAFSSSWPTLKIYKNIQTISVENSLNDGIYDLGVLYRHNLGFVPAFLPYGGTSTGVVFDRAEIKRMSLVGDDKNIYIFGNNGAFIGGTYNVGLLIFYLDITTPFQSTSINTGSSTALSQNHDFGLKVSKSNRDINSQDLRDFIVHSSARNPQVHAVVPGSLPSATLPANTTFSYTHDLPYNPLFFAYTERTDPGKYFLTNGFAGLKTQGNTISLTGALSSANPTPKVSIIILKDPFTIDDNLINISL